jgi:hypothetical protein
VVVVTHRPRPEDAAGRFPRTTFTGGLEEAPEKLAILVGTQEVLAEGYC